MRKRLLILAVLFAACAQTRYRGPRLLAGAGAVLAGGGSVTFAVGDTKNEPALQDAGAVSLALGLGAILAAGIWASARASCEVDSDCVESEACQRLYTTAGPYGQCIAR